MYNAKQKRPILVTGTMRSGTTWVGKMIGLSPEVIEIFEPFTPRDWNYMLIRKHPLKEFLPFITEHNITKDKRDFVTDSLGYSYSLKKELRHIHSRKDIAKILLRIARFCRINLLPLRIMQKDPHALLSAPWLSAEFSMQVIVTMRHPAAFVYSLKKGKWRYPIRELGKAEALMEGPWAEFADQINSFVQEDYDYLNAGILLWNCLNKIILEYRKIYTEWLFIKHEDLASDPLAGFSTIYRYLNLDFSHSIRDKIIEYSSAANPKESVHPHSHQHDLQYVKRDSLASTRSWKTGLTKEEITHIRKETSRVADQIYSYEEW